MVCVLYHGRCLERLKGGILPTRRGKALPGQHSEDGVEVLKERGDQVTKQVAEAAFSL